VDTFQAILTEGLFSVRDGNALVQQDDGYVASVNALLEPVVGQRVQLALHHVPPNGVKRGSPGLGSCTFPDGKGCPVDHGRYPNMLLSFSDEGVLRKEPWRLGKFDGSVAVIPITGMDGHYGRLGAATIVDVEKMRESLSGLDPATLASAGLDASTIKDMLDRLDKVVG
jgi:hypothetical protein